MLNKKWLKLSACRAEIINSIISAPENWIAVKLFDKNGVRLLSGEDLINTNFDFLFFRAYPSDIDIDTSWLIFTPNKELKNEIMSILKFQSATKSRLIPSFRSPMIKDEDKWIYKVISLQSKSKVYARYEGDDILTFEGVYEST